MSTILMRKEEGVPDFHLDEPLESRMEYSYISTTMRE